MKRKRNSESHQLADLKTCDLILTDARGRSMRVHRGLLINNSDYFAQLLRQNNLDTLHLDEKYLLELINYLYKYESLNLSRFDRVDFEIQQQPNQRQLAAPFPMSLDSSSNPNSASLNIVNDQNQSSSSSLGSTQTMPTILSRTRQQESLRIMNGDIEILMNLLVLANKYGFRQLFKDLMGKIHSRMSPSSIITIYNQATSLNLIEIQQQTRLMILSWLPYIIRSQAFLSLPEEAIRDIFSCEQADIDTELKLNALSAWWTKNKDSDMTNLWKELMICSHKHESDSSNPQ